MSKIGFYRTIAEAKWQDRSGRADQIKRAQHQRLKTLLANAAKQVPLQAERLRGLSVRDFSKIQPTGKQQMLERFADSVNQRQRERFQISRAELSALATHPQSSNGPWYKNKMLLSMTSGTTGASGVILNSRKSWALQRAVVFSRTCGGGIPLTRFNPLKRFRMAYAVLASEYSVSYRAIVDSVKSNKMFANVRCFSTETPIEKLFASIAKFKPNFLQSYPSYLEQFAQIQIKAPVTDLYPEVISSGGDLLSQLQKDLLTQAFPQAKIVNHYGATECLPIANTCRRGNLHLNSDFVIMEPVDQDDQPVASGEFSKHVLLTNLLNDFQPYIRYRLLDTVRLPEEPCECGSPLPVVEIKGRSYPFLPVTDDRGRSLSLDGILILNVVMKQPDIACFQILYHQRNQIDVNVTLTDRHSQESPQQRLCRIKPFLVGLEQVAHSKGCSQSLKFTVNFLPKEPPKANHYKRKMFDTSLKAN